MNKQDMYCERVHINEKLSIQIDQSKDDNLLIFENDIVIMNFSLKRKIYTLFKVLHEIIQSEEYLTIENNKGDVYSGEIQLKDGIYMKVNNIHACLTLDFYKKSKHNNYDLMYLTFLTYTVKTLFQKMLIPYNMQIQKNYKVKHIFKFLDMIMILNYNQNNKIEVIK